MILHDTNVQLSDPLTKLAPMDICSKGARYMLWISHPKPFKMAIEFPFVNLDFRHFH